VLSPCSYPQEPKEGVSSKEKIILESSRIDIFDTPPPTLRVPKFPFQALGKDLGVNVDDSPPTSESE